MVIFYIVTGYVKQVLGSMRPLAPSGGPARVFPRKART